MYRERERERERERKRERERESGKDNEVYNYSRVPSRAVAVAGVFRSLRTYQR